MTADNERYPEAYASMPERAPVEMPVQPLRSYVRGAVHVSAANQSTTRIYLWRAFVFMAALLLAGYGASEMYSVISVGGVTALEWVLLVLFLINFAWISFAFTSATAGFVALLGKKLEADVESGPLKTRTAIVVPVYNEQPERVFAAVVAMMESLASTGHGGQFDWIVLSDSTNPDIWVREERIFLRVRGQTQSLGSLYYRHRPKNAERKAGNIADFVSGWGGAYDHMLVLDADSQMEAQTILVLARAMESDPDAGIIQTVPLVVNRNTLFARLQQFAARVYGPVLAAGLAAWSGKEGNYWGHNAIIRVSAFAACCRLPTLRGQPPFGGHILSHDFVEAALMRRCGYSVYMLPYAVGSYEESPPSLVDLAVRDRRWCQGNLQHARVLRARGLHWVSRVHLANGIMSYLASPIWLAQLLVGIVIVLQSHYVRPEYFTDEFALLPAWPQFDAQRALWLFALTMTILLLPKIYGLVCSTFDSKTRHGAGGTIGLFISTLMEIVLSALIAPVMMLIQTGSITGVLLGRDSGWNPQRRDDGGIPFIFILRQHVSHTLLGIVALVAGMLIAPSLVVWMSPTIGGLILAPMLSWASGQRSIGTGLRWAGILLTPEETSRPSVLERSAVLRRELEGSAYDGPLEVSALVALKSDPALAGWHERILPPIELRKPGDINVAEVVAAAKLADASSITQLVGWLEQSEQNALLNDRDLLAKVMRLPVECGVGKMGG